MNLNPDLVHATWTQTLVSLALIMPVFTILMVWVGLTLEPFMGMAMRAHDVQDGTQLTPRTVFLCSIIIPLDVLAMQAITFVVTVLAFEHMVFAKNKT